LRHCHGQEAHARGCWVVDLLLQRIPELLMVERDSG
jgi:hypothetical protein